MYTRQYSITEEPYACRNCEIIMQAEQAESGEDGEFICPICNNELETAIKEEF